MSGGGGEERRQMDVGWGLHVEVKKLKNQIYIVTFSSSFTEKGRRDWQVFFPSLLSSLRMGKCEANKVCPDLRRVSWGRGWRYGRERRLGRDLQEEWEAISTGWGWRKDLWDSQCSNNLSFLVEIRGLLLFWEWRRWWSDQAVYLYLFPQHRRSCEWSHLLKSNVFLPSKGKKAAWIKRT